MAALATTSLLQAAGVTAADSTPPTISILMALHGRGDLAVAALRSLEATTSIPNEIIVVDNASPDGSADRLESATPRAKVIRSALNLGFGAAIDLAALHARGSLLLVLNSDVSFEPGWLEPLLAALERLPSVAAVSPALLNADGTAVEEMGSALHGDGSTSVIADDSGWEAHRPRSVPYASAACLLIRRRDFDLVGGFDAAYPRGYYEDVELALALRHRGLSVYCEPRSRVRHLRGGSTSPARATELMVFNRQIFLRRNAEAVASRPRWGHRSRFRSRDSAAIDRLLVIDDRVPNVDRGSGDPRMSLLLGRIATRFPEAAITLLPTQPIETGRYAPALAGAGVEVADLAETTPAEWLAARIGHYSAVMISRHGNLARLRSSLEATQPQALRVVDVEAVASLREFRRARVLEETDDVRSQEVLNSARRIADAEVEEWLWAEVLMCVTPEEAAIVSRSAPAREVVVTASAVSPIEVLVPRSSRGHLAFMGGFMSGEDAPNADGLRHLVDEVMPAVWIQLPEVHLDVIGADPTPSVLARAGDRVHVMGAVDDPIAAISRHLVLLAPQRFGSGIKLKFLDAMAAGTPFVTTPFGAEGLHLGDLSEVLVGRSPVHLAELAARLVRDADLWTSVQSELLSIAREHFSTERFDRSVDQLMAHLGAIAA